MTDLLQKGAEYLRDKILAHGGRTVTYRRGVDWATPRATVSNDLLRLAPSGNGKVEIVRTDRDYLIDPRELVLSGSQAEPALGDRIEDATDGVIFEVLGPRGEPPWRYADSRRKLYRIHCKAVGLLS
jgi:hypothetical protein